MMDSGLIGFVFSAVAFMAAALAALLHTQMMTFGVSLMSVSLVIAGYTLIASTSFRFLWSVFRFVKMCWMSAAVGTLTGSRIAAPA
jgi:hypothetical protein